MMESQSDLGAGSRSIPPAFARNHGEAREVDEKITGQEGRRSREREKRGATRVRPLVSSILCNSGDTTAAREETICEQNGYLDYLCRMLHRLIQTRSLSPTLFQRVGKYFKLAGGFELCCR